MGGLVKGVTDAVGLTDSSAAEASMAKAMGLTAEQVKMLKKVDVPDIEKMRIILQSPELVGQLQAEQLGPSALEEVRIDPELQGLQMQALQSLKQRAEQGGLTPEDKFQMEELIGQVGAQERSQRAAIDQEMARQGMADSGQAERAKLANMQNVANQGRQQAMQLGAQASQNKMSALQNMGNVAGQMQQTDYARQSNLASAKDAIARANAANLQNVNAQNLGARQAIENQRRAIANQQEIHNKGLYQQNFQNQMTKTGAVSGAMGNQANMFKGQAEAQAAADAATIGTLTKIGAGFATGGASLAATGLKDGGMVYKDGGTCKAEDGSIMFESKGKGHLVDGDSYAGDRVDAKINSGEAVLNVAQQQRLMDILRGKESVDSLGDEDIVEGVPKSFQKGLKDKIESDTMENGLKKLLKILGNN